MNSGETCQKILIVDDVALNRELLSDLLCEQYEIIEAKDGNEALLIMQEQMSNIALVLLDMVMPGKNGQEVLQIMNENGWISEIPVVMISSETLPATIETAYKLGVTDYISRPFDQFVVQNRVRNTILLYNKQRKLTDLVASQILEKNKNNSLLVTVLSHIVEFRNGESGMHVLHINTITNLLMHALMKRTQTYKHLEEDIDIISTASSMHDIGKITIPDEILNKPGRFTPDEFAIMKQHSMNGAMILSKVSFGKDEPLMKYAYQICRWHHERWDGRGYPDGLKGDDIPISAQIVSLADVYDALTSDRCYKKAYSHDSALQMIRNNECGVFNPILLQCLNDVADILPIELNKQSLITQDFAKVLEEMPKDEKHSMYTQVYKQVSFEQKKNKFLESLLTGIIFEYTHNPKVLKISAQGAKLLDLPETIVDPNTSEKLQKILGGETWESFLERTCGNKDDESPINMESKLKLNDADVLCKMKLQNAWDTVSSEKPILIATYGHITLST